MKRLLALMVMLLAYPGNADTIIDGSSQETFQKSIKEMIESYASSEMKEAFSTALLKKLWAKDPLTANLSGLALMAVIPQAAEPPHLNWSSAMFRERRTDNDEQTTEAGRDYHEVEAS